MIADAHAHLDAFSAAELGTVLAEARRSGVSAMVTVGMDCPTSARGVAIAAAEADVHAAVGLHPWLAQDHPDGAPLAELRALGGSPGVVAIGEIGLDFVGNTFRDLSYRDPVIRRQQEDVFRDQLRLANELALPVILHSRGAHEAVLRILAEEGSDRHGGCVQFFEGSEADVSSFAELGFMFSVGASITEPDCERWLEVVRAIPADRLLLESDAPWLPYVGKGSDRSAPADLAVLGPRLARVRGLSDEDLFSLTEANLEGFLATTRKRASVRVGGGDQAFDYVLRGDLVLPDRVVRGGALGIKDELIAAVFERDPGSDAPTVDYSGRYVFPGLVDTHVHAGSIVGEDLGSTTAAAAAGGVTTIVDMPFDRGAPVMGAARLGEKVIQVEETAVVDVGLYGTMPKDGGLGVLDELVDGGVLAFKFSLFEYDPARFPRIRIGDLVGAFESLSAARIPIVLHNELQEVTEYYVDRILGTPAADHPLAHSWSHPPVAETSASVLALDLAYWTGARLHLAHCTHPHTFRLIEDFREMGARVSGETCVHYLAFDEAEASALGTLGKVNPPIRDADSREVLWELLGKGAIASISTDHAPWPLEAKEGGSLAAASGVPGVETLLPVIFTLATRRELPLPDLIAHLTSRPAEIFGIADRKGRLEVGLDADLAVFDPRSPWTFRAAEAESRVGWSPFDGVELAGRVEATYVRGRLAYRDGEVVGEPGSGRWLRRAARPRQAAPGVPTGA
ncbi:MAG: TatD family hydrolase [Actinobacteria bacterium]|nr:TatD family hydrolase [Actinomycetota bacterium]